MKNSNIMRRLGFAFSGIWRTLRREASFRWQVAAASLLPVFCVFERPSALWCALFIFAAALVLVLEMINTAIEAVLDRLHPSFDVEIGFAKDCLAGAVLIASFASVLIFGFYILSEYGQLLTDAVLP